MIRLMLLALVPALALTIAGCSDSTTAADMNGTPPDMSAAQDLSHHAG
jgi:hypothetical protein